MVSFPRLKDEAVRFEDERGYLEVLYESSSMVLKRSFSRKGVFRGLHAQYRSTPQVKLVRVIDGAILDFVTRLPVKDGKVEHTRLAPSDGWVRIDSHLAHGFYALEDSYFEYICDGGYAEDSEVSLSIAEHVSRITGDHNLIMSAKDRHAPTLAVDEQTT